MNIGQMTGDNPLHQETVLSGQRELRSSRLPTEPCVRIRTRLLMQLESIDEFQTNVSALHLT
jgi:hypothetical protein